MKKMDASLIVLMVVMLVNALSFGIIIPLLYPYANRFGIGPVGLSFLFASFSLAQFIATPILGRFSDKYGRKPVLLICLLGTSLSLGLFAAAKTVAVLFIARVIDGITGGNISVAQAVIADTTKGEERTKAFGLLGASFGFGFVFGPALGGILSEISITAPFWFASMLALAGTCIGWVFLKESLPPEKRESSEKPLFPVMALLRAFSLPMTGILLFIGFITSTAQNAWIIGFQSFTVDVLKLSARNVGLLFTGAGIVTIVMQSVGIKFLLEKMKSKKNILTISLVICTVILIFMSLATQLVPFAILMLIYIFALSPQGAMAQGIISERTHPEDQGGILGINQAYMSLGQIIGPLIAGYVSAFSIHYVFAVSCGLFLIATLASRLLYIPVTKKLDL